MKSRYQSDAALRREIDAEIRRRAEAERLAPVATALERWAGDLLWGDGNGTQPTCDPDVRRRAETAYLFLGDLVQSRHGDLGEDQATQVLRFVETGKVPS